jgi:hypothetical protein
MMVPSRLICDHCGGVIGVYDPLVAVIDSEGRESSRAAEPTLGSQSGERYHRACYLERFGPEGKPRDERPDKRRG